MARAPGPSRGRVAPPEASRSWASRTGPEQQANFHGPCSGGSTDQNPDVGMSPTRRPATSCRTQPLDRGRGRQPARHGARLPQPGLVKDFVGKKALKPLDFAKERRADEPRRRCGPARHRSTATLYGFLFKAANKSTVWYNVKAFKDAGVEPPATWDDLLAAAKTLDASGTPGRTRSAAPTAGRSPTCSRTSTSARRVPRSTTSSSTHEIPWTDQSVEGRSDDHGPDLRRREQHRRRDGRARCRPTSRPRSANVFSDSPKAAMVIEGDFVPGDSRVEPRSRRRATTSSRSRPSTTRRAMAVGGGHRSSNSSIDSACDRGPGQDLPLWKPPRSGAKIGEFCLTLTRIVSPGRDPTNHSWGDRRGGDVPVRSLRPPACEFGGTVGQGSSSSSRTSATSPTTSTPCPRPRRRRRTDRPR